MNISFPKLRGLFWHLSWSQSISLSHKPDTRRPFIGSNLSQRQTTYEVTLAWKFLVAAADQGLVNNNEFKARGSCPRPLEVPSLKLPAKQEILLHFSSLSSLQLYSTAVFPDPFN